MKKSKTKFKKYLEKNNLDITPMISGMSDEVKLSYTLKFYEGYLDNLHEVDSVNGMRMFSGTSEDGNNCTITDHGGLLCEATGFVANPVTYLLEVENLLTERGAYNRYYTMVTCAVNSSEGSVETLDKDHLFDRINSFQLRTNDINIDNKLESFGLKKEEVNQHPFWFDGVNRFFYLDLTWLDLPVCKHTWRFDGGEYQENSYGVRRLINTPDADRIYFVENPMQLVSMAELVSDPVYVRPTTEDCVNHDFGQLIKGKEVLCMTAKNPRNADPTALDLTELQSDDIQELLYFYGQSLSQKGVSAIDVLRNLISIEMDEALASIHNYIQEKGIRL